MKRWLLFSLQLLITQIVSWVILFSPMKQRIQSYLFSNKEELMAVAEGDLDGLGNKVKVLKYKSKLGIRIEFLRGNSRNTAIEFLNQENINHPYNGYFMYRGHTVQLGMVDMDGDGVMEVVAPSFDKNLMAHLNVFKYNQVQDKFFMY